MFRVHPLVAEAVDGLDAIVFALTLDTIALQCPGGVGRHEIFRSRNEKGPQSLAGLHLVQVLVFDVTPAMTACVSFVFSTRHKANNKSYRHEGDENCVDDETGGHDVAVFKHVKLP